MSAPSSILASHAPIVTPIDWQSQLADALSTAQNEYKTISLLIRRGDNGLGRRLQLETAERRVRVLSGQLADARTS